MLKPRALQPGDRLAVVAPASSFVREEFDRGIEEIRRLGLVPVYDERVFDRDRYLAGSAAVRAAAVRDAWADPSIAALIGVRGGYGSAQILPLLNREDARHACKPFIGYSDLTAMLTYLTIGCGMVAFHGPMLDRRLSKGAAGYDLESFSHALTRAEPMGELSSPDLETIRTGDAKGMLLGGTLTQLLASIGTPFAFAPPRGFVLFLDEVGSNRRQVQLWQTRILARRRRHRRPPGRDEPN
jgi:muramoyltetrapeptide carboxypeptidase